jgi:hypothetical protein
MWDMLYCFECWKLCCTSRTNTDHHSIKQARGVIFLFVPPSATAKDTRTSPLPTVDACVYCQQCRCEIVGNYTDKCLRFSQHNCNCIQKALWDNIHCLSSRGAKNVVHCPNTNCNSIIYICHTVGHNVSTQRPCPSKTELYQLSTPDTSPPQAIPTLDQGQEAPPQHTPHSRTIPLRLFSADHRIALGLNMLVPPKHSDYPSTEVYINRLIAFSDFNIDKVSILVSDCQMGPSTSNIYDERYMPLFLSCHEPMT